MRELKFEVSFLAYQRHFIRFDMEGLIFKLEQIGISGKLLRFIKDFLSDRKQCVVLNGQCSTWVDAQAGVPQGSILDLYFYYFILTIYCII